MIQPSAKKTCQEQDYSRQSTSFDGDLIDYLFSKASLDPEEDQEYSSQIDHGPHGDCV